MNLVWPLAAFWSGASLLFLSSGLLALLNFGYSLVRARGVWQNLSLTGLAWLWVGGFFLLCGVVGCLLVWQLLRRRPFGYYASLLLGLLLVLLAPFALLTMVEPDYLKAILAAIIPGAVVLLTLATLGHFEGGRQMER